MMAEERVQELESLNAQLEERMRRLMEKTQESQSKAVSKISSLNEQNKELQQKVEMLLKRRVSQQFRSSEASNETPAPQPSADGMLDNDAQAQKDLASAQAEIAQLQRNIADLQSTIATSQTSLDQSTTQMQDLTKQHTAMRADLDSLQNRFTEAVQLLERERNLRAQCESDLKLVQDKFSDAEAKRREAHQKTTSLELQLSQEKTNTEELKNRLAERPPSTQLQNAHVDADAAQQHLVEELQSDNQKLQAQLSEVRNTGEARIALLEQEIATLKYKEHETVEQIEHSQNVLNATKAELEAAQATSASNLADITAQHELVNKLKNEHHTVLTDLRKGLEKEQEENSKLTEKIKLLEAEKMGLLDKVDTQKKAIAKREEEWKAIKQQITVEHEESVHSIVQRHSLELEDLRVKSSSALKESEAAKEKILKESRARTKEQMRKDEENMERLRIMEAQLRTLAEESSDVTNLRNTVQELQIKVKKSDSRAQGAESRVSKLESKLEEAESSATNARQELQTSQQLFASKTVEVQKLYGRVNELESKVDSERLNGQRALSQALSQSERALADAQAQAAEADGCAQRLQSQLETLAAKVASLEKEASAHKEQMNLMQKEESSAKEQIVRLDSQLEEARKELTACIEQKKELEDAAERASSAQQLSAKLADDLEALSNRETHLKQVNRSLKDEVRKLSRANSAVNMSPASTPFKSSLASSPPSSPLIRTPLPKAPTPLPSTSSEPADDGDSRSVNVTYLKSVFLSFLEKREMRPQLVPVLQALLNCSTDEARRLQTLIDA